MANNRMFIACDGCGKVLGLAKYFPSQGWGFCMGENFDIKFDAFMHEHKECGDYDAAFGPEHFRLATDLDLAFEDGSIKLKQAIAKVLDEQG